MQQQHLTRQDIAQFTKKEIITKHPVIIRVSNNADIDKTMIDDKIAPRIKQTSSLVAQQEFEKLKLAIDTKINMIGESTYSGISGDFIKKYKSIVNQEAQPKDTLTALLQLDVEFHSLINQTLSNTHQELKSYHDQYLQELEQDSNAELSGVLPVEFET